MLWWWFPFMHVIYVFWYIYRCLPIYRLMYVLLYTYLIVVSWFSKDSRIPVDIIDKLSSRQLLDFIRSEEKGELLHLILILRCSMCMLRCLSMPSMFCCSMHMPIGWELLNMPTDGCSVCMPIIIINSKLKGVEQDSFPSLMKVILTHIPVEWGVVDFFVDRFLNGSCLAMVLPPYDGEVTRVGVVSWNVTVAIDWSGFFQVLFISLPKGPGCLFNIFLIKHELPTLVPVDGPTLSVYGSLSLGLTSIFLIVLFPFKWVWMPYL